MAKRHAALKMHLGRQGDPDSWHLTLGCFTDGQSELEQPNPATERSSEASEGPAPESDANHASGSGHHSQGKHFFGR